MLGYPISMKSSESNRLSILMFTMSFHPSPMGGAEIQAFRLAKELMGQGMDVSFITLAQKGQSKRDVIDGIEVFRIRLFLSPFYHSAGKITKDHPVQVEYEKNNPENFKITQKRSLIGYINYLIFFLNAYFFMRGKRIEVIYVPTMEWLAFVSVMLGRITKKSVLIKDSTMNGITNLLRYRCGTKMKEIICRNGYFVAMTNVIYENYCNAGIATNRIFRIPNGVRLQPRVDRKVDPNKFIFVGNLSQQPAKGVDILLKAWKMVIMDLPNVHLYIIGDGNLASYQEYITRLGIQHNVHFTGKQSQFQNDLLESMAFILPSRREGMSNALLEAMSLGVTCIATDISGNQDLLKNKINGLLVPVEDEAALADAVRYVFNNQKEALVMGLEAQKTIENGYTLNSVCQKYNEVFRSISEYE